MKTKRVRIAIVINDEGKWCSAGWDGVTEKKLRDIAFDSVIDGHAHWIEADIPIPESTVIEGNVKEESGE